MFIVVFLWVFSIAIIAQSFQLLLSGLHYFNLSLISIGKPLMWSIILNWFLAVSELNIFTLFISYAGVERAVISSLWSNSAGVSVFIFHCFSLVDVETLIIWCVNQIIYHFTWLNLGDQSLILRFEGRPNICSLLH